MLSLKKKSDAEAVDAPLWHTNFRNFERLPDTKVVRTTFFINTAAVALAIGMLLWLGYREYTNYNIKEQTAVAQRQINGNRKQNAEALRLSKLFLDESKKLADAGNFLRVAISPVEYIAIIGETLPKELTINFADARFEGDNVTNFILRGQVAGTPDQASGIASSYVDMLRAQPRLSAIFDPITLRSLNRDPGGNFLVFEITLSLKPGARNLKK